MNRLRHLPTVTRAHRRSTATLLLSAPSAHTKTILQRNANACDDVARLDHDTSWERSSSVNVSKALGRPVLAMPQSIKLSSEFLAQDTS